MSVGVDPTRAEVASELEALGDVSVAVRSSSVAEDLPDASFAGQYVSVLGARGIDAVMEAIARVRESATSLRARSYGGGQTAGMAVLVQRLIEGDASGVAFSANPSPETGQRSSSPPIRVRNRKLRRLLCVGSLLLIPPAIAACGRWR